MTSSSQVDTLFDLIGEQILHGDYTEAIASGERLLNYLPQHAPLRADALAQLATAHAMLQNFTQSYEALTEALALQPNNAELWYNRSIASRYTSRFGRALQDIERAIDLSPIPELAKDFDRALKLNRKLVKKSMKLQGPNFTLDQLIEQEDFFQQGLKLMQEGNWDEAGQAFQTSIALGDCLPQPWGNLGACFIMQERYDEAEAALNRALVIDRRYTFAKNNLKLLAEARRTGPPKIMGIYDPFKNAKMKQSITFIAQ